MTRNLFAGVCAVALVGGFAVAAELKSGPQSGEKVPGPFHPLNVTGEDAGQKTCLYCKNGEKPVAVVFARNPECPQTQKLIKALDEATQKNAKAEMGSYAVFLTADSTAEAKLKKVAADNKLKALVLSIESPEGPSKYNISKDADVTVLLYTDFVVKGNYTFEKGKVSDKDIETITKDVSKILPTK
jgi:hypothetical protein